jgi:hypothetical protein
VKIFYKLNVTELQMNVGHMNIDQDTRTERNTKGKMRAEGFKEVKEKQKKEYKICLCTLTEHHAMKAYRISGGMAPRILDFGTHI